MILTSFWSHIFLFLELAALPCFDFFSPNRPRKKSPSRHFFLTLVSLLQIKQMWQVLHMRTSLVLYPVSFLIIKRHCELSPAAEVYLHVIWFYLRRHLISSRVIFATHYFFFNFAICFLILVCIRATECLMIYSTKCLSYVACHLSTIEIAVQRKTNDSWTPFLLYLALINTYDLTCKCGSVDQSEGLLIPRSSVRFRLKPKNSNSYGF